MSPFTACIVQTTSLPYDKQGNLDRALRAMEAAAARGASLILFPEMFLTGYLIRDQLAQLAEPYPNGPALTVLGQKAKALSLGVVMGMPLANPGGKPYNAVVMIDRDGTPAGFQAKTHFFGGEEKMFAPGTSLRAFDTSFGRMGILVCYDGEFPETARSLALDGAKLICMCAPMRTTTSCTCGPGPWRTARIPSTATMSETKSGSTTAARAEPSTPPGAFWRRPAPRRRPPSMPS